MENKSFATVGVGTPDERKIEIKDFIEMSINSRTITVVELENQEGYLLMVENDPDTGMHPRQEMWLSEDSLVSLLAVLTMLLSSVDKDFDRMLDKALSSGDVNFKSSVSLKKMGK